MGRKKKWPPSVLPHKSSGRDRVRIDGVDHYLGPIGSDESKAAYARLLADHAAGKPLGRAAVPAAALTVADAAAEWLAQEAPRLSERGRERGQFRLALAPLLRLYGPTPAAAFDADRLEAVQVAMASGSWLTAGELAARPARCRTMCRATVNRHVVRLRTVWRWCERKKLVPAGSWAALCALPGLKANDARVRHRPRRKAATLAEVLAVGRKAARPVRPMLLVMWWSGCRSGEVRTMRACDLDRSGAAWVYRPSRHKTDWRGHERAVALGRRAQAVLAPWLARAAGPEAFLFPPARSRHESTHYSRDGFAQAVRRAAKAAGLPGWCAYQCRHAFKTRVTRALGLDAARAALGQSSVETANSYASGTDLAAAVEAARRLG